MMRHFTALCLVFVVVSADDIVETAVGTGDHTVFAEALTKANLVETLKGAGPFTVFAPTDAAFNNYLTRFGMTKQEFLDIGNLADILKYHVLSGKILSSELSASQDVVTLYGPKVTITSDGSSVKFAEATVTGADVTTSNGVIHVIDTVILPPSAALDVVQTAMETGSHGILVEALTKANLVDTLNGGLHTVFAPTDAAFGSALATLGITKAELLERADLADILKYHVLSGETLSFELSASQEVTTLLGKTITITKDGDTVKYGEALVTTADVEASDGVIHVIDKVVLPPADTTDTTNTDVSAANERHVVMTWIGSVALVLCAFCRE